MNVRKLAATILRRLSRQSFYASLTLGSWATRIWIKETVERGSVIRDSLEIPGQS